MDDKYVVIYVTCANSEESKKISNALLESRLVACVNTVPEIFSTYWWQEKIETSEEVFLIMKSKTNLVNEIIETVKKNHSYDVPEVIALPIIAGNPDYLKWIKENTK